MNCYTGSPCPPGGMTWGATPAPMYHQPMQGYPMQEQMYPPIGPSGVLNMDIGPNPGLINMDMGGPYPCGPCGPVPMAPEAPTRIHVVLRCETPWTISRLYNVDLDVLLQANNLNRGSTVYVGQRLTVPGGLTFNIG
ncbi:MAG TPA: LysM peptidoglycan-binding domain-containing protein [Candidatus Deferrimicrobium sp.]|nr:LysM peptidoglycan-binding domain-containing protein [Candidatus Deferrimicrobium sp.]